MMRKNRGVAGRVSWALVRRLLIRDGSSCRWCGRCLELHEITLDHLIPESQGGRGLDNLVAACKFCNSHRAHNPMTLREPVLRIKDVNRMIKKIHG